MSEERDDLLVLVDEDGQEVSFEYLDTVEMNGNEYAVLLPVDEGEEQQTSEVVILKVEHNAEEQAESEEIEDCFVSVEDENELTAVFEEFKRKMKEQYDFDEE